MKVFIADDSPVIRNLLASSLSGMKEVEIVGSGDDSHTVLESIEELKPDVVILDIRMRAGSGFDILRQIKEEKSETKVIVFTNCAYPQYEKRCYDLGADFFFDKSKEFRRLPTMVKNLIPLIEKKRRST